MVVENRNTAVFFRLPQTKMFMQEMEIHIKCLGLFAPFLFVLHQLTKICYEVMCYTQISDKVIDRFPER
jgi:hypothetical protein